MSTSFQFPALRSLALLLAAALALSGCSSGVDGVRAVPHKSQFTGPYPSDFPIHGIDVSKYQGEIDWDSVRRSGVEFAWIKATEGGDHADPSFLTNWNAAKAAGVPRGAYHFVYWCRTPEEEIGWFKKIVPIDPDALPPVLDVEATPTSRTCRRTIQREEAVREMRQMLVDMERHYGKRPVIYVTVDFYQSIMHPDEFSDYPIWVRSTKHSPHIPYPGRRWSFWQYQSDGIVPGIRAKVDRNAFYGSRAQWEAFLDGPK